MRLELILPVMVHLGGEKGILILACPIRFGKIKGFLTPHQINIVKCELERKPIVECLKPNDTA